MKSLIFDFTIILLFVFCALLTPLSIQNSFAEDEKLSKILIFVTSQNDCDDHDWDVVQSIDAMTREYLYEWNIDQGTSDWDCIVENKMSFAVEQAKSTHDLTILILDEKLSDEKLDYNTIHPRGGHYVGWGNYNVVVTPSPRNESNTEDDRSVEVLVHELSHFAVDWYDYPCDVSNADSCVHRHQAIFDNCIAYGTPDSCLANNLLTRLDAPKTGKIYDVMSPLFTERYSASTQQNNNDYKSSDNSFTIQKIQESKNYIQSTHKKIMAITFVDINAVILKNTDYQNEFNSLKSEKYNWDSRLSSSYDDARTANYLEDQKLYDESLKKLQGIVSEVQEIYSGYYSYGKKLSNLLDKDIKLFEERSIVQKKPEKTLVNVIFELGKLNDEYGKYEEIWVGGYISNIHGLDNSPELKLYFQNYDKWIFLKSKNVKMDGTMFNTNFGYAGIYKNGNYKVTATHFSNIAEKEISDTEFFTINSSSVLSRTYFSEPVKLKEISGLIQHYQNTLNSFQSPDAKKLVEFTPLEYTRSSAKEILENYEKHDKVYAGWQVHFSQIDAVIEQAKIIEKEFQESKNTSTVKHDSSNNLISENESDYWNPASSKSVSPTSESTTKEMWKKYEQLESQIKELQKNNQELESSLTGITSQSSVTQQRINDAWNLLKENKKDIEFLEEQKLNRMSQNIKDEFLGNAEGYYNQAESKIQVMDGNSNQISEIIKQTGNEVIKVEQTCFLFWCW